MSRLVRINDRGEREHLTQDGWIVVRFSETTRHLPGPDGQRSGVTSLGESGNPFIELACVRPALIPSGRRGSGGHIGCAPIDRIGVIPAGGAVKEWSAAPRPISRDLSLSGDSARHDLPADDVGVEVPFLGAFLLRTGTASSLARGGKTISGGRAVPFSGLSNFHLGRASIPGPGQDSDGRRTRLPPSPSVARRDLLKDVSSDIAEPRPNHRLRSFDLPAAREAQNGQAFINNRVRNIP